MDSEPPAEETIEAVNTGLAGYDMDNAARALYEFLWSEYADWYIEMAKPRLQTGRTGLWSSTCCGTSWRRRSGWLHPIMPFITEVDLAVDPSRGKEHNGCRVPGDIAQPD